MALSNIGVRGARLCACSKSWQEKAAAMNQFAIPFGERFTLACG
ncbi:hypothetical protein [Paraburkholderia bryophila]|nr:hypothetical protein [Paraburkholderia bryophila]